MLFPFLTTKELEVMTFDHKYKSYGSSIIDNLFLKAWANWLVEKLPTKHSPTAIAHWSAPNSLTFIGLCCMVIPSTIIMCTAPDLVSPSPQWAYVATAAGIFCYQTLDELDGKQARRTGSSTCLGELFDHGCDAVSTFVTVAACLCVCQTDLTIGAFSAYLMSLMAFQGAHIQTYYKGSLFFGIVDVAEAQWSGIMMNLVCGLYDPNFFSSGSLYGVSYQTIPMWFVLMGSGSALIRNFYSSAIATSDNVPHAYTSPLVMWTQFSLMFALSIAWFVQARDVIVGWDRILFLTSLGLANASQTVTIIVAHMARTKVPVSWSCARLIPLALAVINAHLGFVPNRQVILVYFCLTLVHFLHYSVSLAAQIATFLGVSVFKLGGATCVDTRS